MSCVVAAAGLAMVGCSVSAPSSEAPTSVVSSGRMTDAGAVDGGSGASASDAEQSDAGQAVTTVGYALCVDTNGCNPDAPTTAQACALAPDGGPYDPAGGYGSQTLACRVQPATSVNADGVGAAPVCTVAGRSTDGVACRTSTDCAAGFDCIVAAALATAAPDLDAGVGVCRHYCCGGDGACSTPDGGISNEFCDIQPLAVATTTKVPVCMPIAPCTLLSAKSVCPMGDTCGIVRDDGTTSCVETGPQNVGQSCDTNHCKAGLVCLGAPNMRQCYELCSTKSSACTAPETCQGGLPLFQDPTVGVCR